MREGPKEEACFEKAKEEKRLPDRTEHKEAAHILVSVFYVSVHRHNEY